MSRALRWLAGSLAAVVLVGSVSEWGMERWVLARHPLPGRLVDVGGYRLHLDCVGEGSPTVVLEAGLGHGALSWFGVQPAVAPRTRVCSYDRAGYFWSEPPNRERSLANLVDDLHRLLSAAGEEGPYVLVGHSLGGLLVQRYAEAYPADVVGLVLVDSVHEEQAERERALTGKLPDATLLDQIGTWLSYIAVTRLVLPAFDPGNPNVPADVAQVFQRVKSQPASLQAQLREKRLFASYLTEARAAGQPDLQRLPLVVLSRGKGAVPAWEEQWQAMQADLVSRSEQGEQRVIVEADHQIQWDDPQAVIQAIITVLERARD